jgi:outer membrane protein assembly factor BamB
VLASNGTVDCIYGGCEDAEPPRFYGIKVGDFRPYRSDASASTKFADFVFNGHAAFCQATQHIIVGSDEGELYALKVANLSVEWRYPGMTREDSLTGESWGAPAISGNKIYIGNETDSVFFFIDNGGTVSRIAAYGLNSPMVDAPVIDAAGNVYFGTDSGYLYKFGPNLDFQWRVLLIANKSVNGAVIGKDGVIYCTSEGEQPADPARLYAVNADGTMKWPSPGYVTTYGLGTRPAVDADGHIYLGTQVGRFYKFNKDDGTAMWRHFYGNTEFNTTPIVVQGGYLYAQNVDDVLYCADRSTGDTVWVCDCRRALPRPVPRARKMELYDYDANPTITADGNIVVAGKEAVYLVKGYPERLLDTSAPWPKWQKNLSNTGK